MPPAVDGLARNREVIQFLPTASSTIQVSAAMARHSSTPEPFLLLRQHWLQPPCYLSQATALISPLRCPSMILLLLIRQDAVDSQGGGCMCLYIAECAHWK